MLHMVYGHIADYHDDDGTVWGEYMGSLLL